MAIFVEQAGLHHGVALVLTGAVCLLVGYLLGMPARRLQCLHLALVTFALAVAVLNCLSTARWSLGRVARKASR